MARGHGRILTSIWEDSDFLKLDEKEQRFYLFLISQPNLNHAGLLPLTLRRWSRKANGLTAADVEKRLQSLDDARFIVMDDDTEELLIRSFVRNDGVWKQPKVMGAMVSGAMEISSRRLRRALLAEVERIPLGELSNEPGSRGVSIRQQVSEHIETLRKVFREPDPTPSGRGSGTPSAPPSGTPSDTPTEGDRKASTRAHAPASRAHSPAPAPAPTTVSAEAGEQPPVDVEETGFAGAPEGASDEGEPVTAQTIVGEWLNRTSKRPPKAVIGQVAKQIKKLLDEGIAPDDIRGGLAIWMTKGYAPSAIPSFVNQAMNTTPAQQGPTTAPRQIPEEEIESALRFG
ncbi:hypothetical protein [Streptomyces reticuli]|uniref:hypothetical protein n=1 Tax=Streptomyces reticuli TaxID=1926 RepID=UPI00073DC50B|nr:hypothetical protein [Streptomyces sp. SID7810]CUW31727.1 hypothetical protein TUE45_06476 [Streptomyces reticuli]